MDCQGDNSQLPSVPAMLASNQVLSWRRWDLTRLGRELQTNGLFLLRAFSFLAAD
jgi:hypothetical protein